MKANEKWRRPRQRSFVALFACAWVSSLLAGCAAPARTAPSAGVIASTDWPTRITAGLDRLASNTPHCLGPDQLDSHDSRGPAPTAESSEHAVTVVRAVALGLGVVLELEYRVPEGTSRSPDETEFAFVSFSAITRDGRRVDPERVRLPKEITLADIRNGVCWRLYEPKGSPLRGLVVHLGGNKYVRRALRKRGWAVLSSSGTGRYSQRRESPQVFEIRPDDDLQELAGRLAAIIDDELADWPYSLEAVLQYLAVCRPDISQEPLAVMGFSIGALGLPAVVARLPERFEAAVVVAGGANLLEIAHGSRKANRGIELKCGDGRLSQELWRRLSAAYLEHAKLDPYHTAAALAEIPVLLFHAHYDQVVPAATGELLYTRLGKPQRFVFPVGHGHLLRAVMRLQAGRVVEWTEAALSKQPVSRARHQLIFPQVLARRVGNASIVASQPTRPAAPSRLASSVGRAADS